MYADDANLGQRIDDVSDINQQLIPDFRKLCEWLEINKLSLNFMKTEFLLFGDQSQLRNFDDLVGISINPILPGLLNTFQTLLIRLFFILET